MLDLIQCFELWFPAILCLGIVSAVACSTESTPPASTLPFADAGPGDDAQASSRSAVTTSAQPAGSGAKGATRLTRSAKRP